MSKKILIIGNGHLCRQCLEYISTAGAYIIAADGGLDRCRKLDIKPDMVTGDMDSASQDWSHFIATHNIPLCRYPVRKNRSDMEIAADLALDMNPAEIILAGALGGRLDHMLFNLQLLHHIMEREIPVRITSCRQEAVPADNPHILNEPEGTVISMVPVTPKLTGVTLQGFSYPLSNQDLTYGTSRGLSNLVESSPAIISFRQGKLLLIINRNPDKTHD